MPDFGPTIVPTEAFQQWELDDLHQHMNAGLEDVNQHAQAQAATASGVVQQGSDELKAYMDASTPPPLGADPLTAQAGTGVGTSGGGGVPIPADQADRAVPSTGPVYRMGDSGDNAHPPGGPKDFGPLQPPGNYTIAFGFKSQYDHPFNSSIPLHRGVDLVLPSTSGHQNGRGTPVTAFQPGIVAAITHDPNGGNGVIVQMPNGLYQRYFHFDQINPELQVGAKVSRATQLGTLGATGTEGFPHLHFEVSKGINGDPQDQLIDPRPFLSGATPGDVGAPNARDAFGAQVDNLPFKMDDASDRVKGTIGFINKASQQTGVPQGVIAAIMDTEQSGSHSTSPAGAAGWMQVLKSHFKPGEDPYDPQTNISRGAEILADNYKRYGNWLSAAAAYFGAVDQYGNPTTASDAGGMTGTQYAKLFAHNADKYGGAPSLGVIAAVPSSFGAGTDAENTGVTAASRDPGAFSRYADENSPDPRHHNIGDYSILGNWGLNPVDAALDVTKGLQSAYNDVTNTDWSSILDGVRARASYTARNASDIAGAATSGLEGIGMAALNAMSNLGSMGRSTETELVPQTDIDKRVMADQNYGAQNASAVIATLEKVTGDISPDTRERLVGELGPLLTPSNLVIMVATGGTSSLIRAAAKATTGGGLPTYAGLYAAKIASEYATSIGGQVGAQEIAKAAGVDDPSARQAIGLVAAIAAPTLQNALLRRVVRPTTPIEYADESHEEGGPLVVRQSSLSGGTDTSPAPLPGPNSRPFALPGTFTNENVGGIERAAPEYIGPYNNEFNDFGNNLTRNDAALNDNKITWRLGTDERPTTTRPTVLTSMGSGSNTAYMEGKYTIRAETSITNPNGEIWKTSPQSPLFQLDVTDYGAANAYKFAFSSRRDAAAVAQGLNDNILELPTKAESAWQSGGPNVIFAENGAGEGVVLSKHPPNQGVGDDFALDTSTLSNKVYAVSGEDKLIAEYPNFHIAMVDTTDALFGGYDDPYGRIREGEWGVAPPVTSTEPPTPVQPQRSTSAMMGQGVSGMSEDIGFKRQMLRKLYSTGGAVNEQAAREIAQNSADASINVPGAHTVISIDNAEKTIMATDQGKGMLPQTVEDAFLRVGGSAKEEYAAGGIGVGIKSALMANAQDLWMRTVSRDPETGKLTDSIIHGDANQFFDKQMPHSYSWFGETPPSVLEGAPKEVKNWEDWHPAGKETGTVIWWKALPDTQWYDSYSRQFATQVGRNSQFKEGGHKLTMVVDGKTIEQGSSAYGPLPKEVMPNKLLKTVETKHAIIKIYGSEDQSEQSYGSIALLNRGQYQATSEINLKGVKAPSYLSADIISKVPVKDQNYPWTLDRNSVSQEVKTAIADFLDKELVQSAQVAEQKRLTDIISKAPSFRGLSIGLIDDTGRLPESTSNRILTQDVYKTMAATFKSLHDRLLDEFLGKTVGAQLIGESKFLGIGPSDKWLGLNVPATFLPGYNAAGANAAFGIETRGIIVNPWKIWEEVRRLEPSNAVRQADLFTDVATGTMVHEIMHTGPVRGHQEDFAGAMTRAMAVIGSHKLLQIIDRTHEIFGPMITNPIRKGIIDDDATLFSEYEGRSLAQFGEESSSRGGPLGNDTGGAGAQGPEIGRSLSPTGGPVGGGQAEATGPVGGNGGVSSGATPKRAGGTRPTDEQIIMQALINRGKGLGMDTADLEKQLYHSMGGSGEPPKGWAATGPEDYGDPSRPLTWREAFNEYHRMNVISSTATMAHVALNAIVNPVVTEVPQIAADIAGGVVGGAMAPIHDVIPKVPLIGIRPSEAVGRTAGRIIALQGAVSMAGADLLEGIRDYFHNPAQPFNRLTPESQIPQSLQPTVGTALRIGGAIGPAVHSAFQQMTENNVRRMELMALAGQKAVQEGFIPFDKEFGNRVEEMLRNPSSAFGADAVRFAEDRAKRAALRAPAGYWQQKLQSIASWPYIGNTLFPVVKISSQILMGKLELAPTGALSTALDVIRSPIAGPYKGFKFNEPGKVVRPLRDRALMNAAGLLATFFALKTMEDTITGNGPSDPQAKATLRAQGWQEWSIHTPKGYVDFKFLGILGGPLAAAGAYGDAVKYSGDNATMEDRALKLVDSMTNYLYSTTGIETLGEIATLMRGEGGALKAGETFAGNIVGGFVPGSGLVKSVAVGSDFGPARKPELGQEPDESLTQTFRRGVGQTIEQNIPIFRRDVPYAQDVIGRQQENPQAGIGAIAPHIGRGSSDAMLSAYTEAGLGIPARATHITYGGVDIPLTIAEQRQYERTRGQALYDMGHGYIDTPDFEQQPQDVRMRILQRVISSADKVARNEVLENINSLDLDSRYNAARIRALNKRPEMVAP